CNDFFSRGGISFLDLDEGLVVHMLIEKKYPLKKEIVVQMLKLKLESEEESTMALELIRFIKKQNQIDPTTRNQQPPAASATTLLEFARGDALLDYERQKLNNLMNLGSNGHLMSRREYALLLRKSTNDVVEPEILKKKIQECNNKKMKNMMNLYMSVLVAALLLIVLRRVAIALVVALALAVALLRRVASAQGSKKRAIAGQLRRHSAIKRGLHVTKRRL
ncbi:hypothetical protein Tco_0645234, partial [Tanacetum coccineum]